MNEEQIYQVNDYLDLVNARVAGLDVVVQGEITQVSNRGHIYFSLSDSDPNQKAVLSCALWKFKAQYLAFELKEGDSVQISGKANIYKPSGRFTFIVESIAPVGEGALKQAFEKLKKELETKGYFDPAKKTPLPMYPEKIAVLTSKAGDAIKDFQTHLGKFGIQVYLLDCRVEGIKAVKEVVAGIQYLNTNHPEIEAIVITRGGGSLESLQAFNSLEVAQAIFSSKIPVLSAVGHENDVTIADLVADYRASTPTAAGRAITQHWEAAKHQLTLTTQKFSSKTKQMIAVTNQKIELFERNFYQVIFQLINTTAQFLRQASQNFTRQINWRIKEYQHTENRFIANFHQFATGLATHQTHLISLNSQLDQKLRFNLAQTKQMITSFSKQLALSDPHLKLKQGYSIVRNHHNQIVKSVELTKPKDQLTLQLYNGSVTSQVTSVERNPNAKN